MAIFHGYIDLSKVDKQKITTNPRTGHLSLWCDIYTRDEPDQYGTQATVVFYDKTTKEKTYLGNFKPVEVGVRTEGAQPSSQGEEPEDLPF